MEWLVLALSILGATVSVIGAYRSSQAATRAEAAERRRDAGRDAIAEAMDLGNQLLEDLRRPDPGPKDVVWRRYEEWEHIAAASVVKADKAQRSRYHRPLPKSSLADAVAERLRRMQEIQDHL